jgi:membrane protease YdiL (CAAX protease family)
MPTDPLQLILAAFELTLLLAGLWFFLRLVAQPTVRSQWLAPRPLPPWPVTIPEFAIFVFLMLACGSILQITGHELLKGVLAHATDHEGLMLCLNGFGFDGGGLLGWLLFRSMRRGWYADYGTEPPPVPPAPRLPWSRIGVTAGYTLLAALPVIIVFNLGWTQVIRWLGLPEDQQDLIAIFANTKSPLVIAGMLTVACVLAPLCEELLFRAGLYRFCRQRLGRASALLISGLLFGAVHANWASLVPLAVLGVVLALVYEATGDIRVPIVTHALFNLNTVLIVLSGLPQ